MIPPFEPTIDVSPFRLYRELREGTAPRLVDLRTGAPATLRGATAPPSSGWRPHPSERVVLLDDDGDVARGRALAWQAEGLREARALYGGMRLWELCFQEEVVGETYVVGTSGHAILDEDDPAREAGRLRTAIWLLPSPPGSLALATTVSELAREHRTPSFTPHVTLRGRAMLAPQGVEDACRALTEIGARNEPLELRVTGIQHSAGELNAVFIVLEESPALADLRRQVEAGLGLQNSWSGRPHLSIAYGVEDEARRREICASTRCDETYRFDGLALARPGNDELGWVDVASWEELFRCRLAGGS